MNVSVAGAAWRRGWRSLRDIQQGSLPAQGAVGQSGKLLGAFGITAAGRRCRSDLDSPTFRVINFKLRGGGYFLFGSMQFGTETESRRWQGRHDGPS